MKLITTTYTFDASAQTIVSADFASIERIALITNVTDNVIIYNFADPTKGGSLSGTTLTLAHDTTGMDDADKLQIILHPDIFNAEGRVKVSTQPKIYDPVTGTITANGQTVSADVSDASNVMLHVTGTFSTVNCIFEGSIDGGTTWFTVQAVRSNANTIETTTDNLSAAPAYAWEASVNALTNFRVRSTAYTSGTQTWRIIRGAYATEPIPAAQVSATQPVSGTVTASNTAGNVANDEVDSGNPVKVGGKAYTANPTAVANADRSDFITDKLGKQVVVGSIRDLKDNQVTTITSSTAQTTIVTAVASVFMDLYGIIITNTSATATSVAIKDSTSGTTRFTIAVPAGETRGFMLPESGAMKQSAVNNNWTATVTDSVASVIITALTVRNT